MLYVLIIVYQLKIGRRRENNARRVNVAVNRSPKINSNLYIGKQDRRALQSRRVIYIT